MSQRSLFDPSTENGTAAAFRRHSATSKAAAEMVSRGLAARQQRVLTFLREHGPSTCKEVARAFDVDMNAVSGRVTELHDKLGRIECTGERREGCDEWRARP
jgi:predicted transcriptional regulator